MKIEKYSFGIGDRFSKEGDAQLKAIRQMNDLGIEVIPVWNKSYREHKIVKTTQAGVLREAKNAVAKAGWSKSFFVDADHIGMETVDEFIEYSNFFTIDVAHFLSQPADQGNKKEFIKRQSKYLGKLEIPGIERKFEISKEFLSQTADTYLMAIHKVATIYNHIAEKKGKENFVAEVSMDETEHAQSPIDLFFILAELKHLGVELQTIAPKFTGLFAKGIDYIGDVVQFAREFEQDVAVAKYVIEELGLPRSLKLSVHSGSDKFSIYQAIKTAVREYDAGIHVKTAGTTWLEEVIGLAEAGGKGLEIAKKIYTRSLERFDELVAPYVTVLKIKQDNLPATNKVSLWDSEQFVNALMHDQSCKTYNPDFRQLIHVGYKVAVEMGEEFTLALDEYRQVIEEQVRYNLLERHLKPIFL